MGAGWETNQEQSVFREKKKYFFSLKVFCLFVLKNLNMKKRVRGGRECEKDERTHGTVGEERWRRK